MILPRKLYMIFRIVAGATACVFLWTQIVWAAEISTATPPVDQRASSMTQTALSGAQSTAQSVVDMRNSIETQSLQATSVTEPGIVRQTFYASGRLQSVYLTGPDSKGNNYYHYIDEDWQGQGYGRVDKTKRQTALNGELSHTYSYYTDATGRLKQVKSYATSSWTTLVATYTYNNDTSNRLKSTVDATGTATYYNDANNRLSAKTLSTVDAQGNIYYHYINEDWNSQGYGRVDKTKRQTTLNGELSHTYSYYTDATGRLKQVKSYATSSWTTLVATYTYYNDTTNRLQSKVDTAGTLTYYNDDNHRLSAKTLTAADAQGCIYYHYVNEDWQGQGYGRVDKTKRQTALNGELSHTYSYYIDATGRLKQVKSYATSSWTTTVATYTYYNDTANRLSSKTLATADAVGNVYYRYINEDWNGQGYGRVDRTRLQTALNGELTFSYTYNTDATGRLKQVKSYATSSWTTLIATYTYYNDTANRLSTKVVSAEGITYTYFNDAANLIASKILPAADAQGNIYYHYKNENWNNQGFGRVDIALRVTADIDGALAYYYTYNGTTDAKATIAGYKAVAAACQNRPASLSDLTQKCIERVYSYYASGRLLYEQKRLLDSQGRYTTWESWDYDDLGNPYYYYCIDTYAYPNDPTIRQTMVREAHNYTRYSDGRINQESIATHYLVFLVGGGTTTQTLQQVTLTYYNDANNLIASKVLSMADADGNVYYHYMNENWQGEGYGRVDKTQRQTSLNGEWTYAYRYYADAAGRLQEKDVFSDAAWAVRVFTEAYFNEDPRTVSTKKMSDGVVYEYDGTTGAQPLRKVNPDGSYVEYSYDEMGTLLRQYEYAINGDIVIKDGTSAVVYVYSYQQPDLVEFPTADMSLTTAAGDIVAYKNDTIAFITQEADGSKITNIELNADGTLKNALIFYADNSVGVVYEGRLIEIIRSNGVVVRYRDSQTATEYASETGLATYRYYMVGADVHSIVVRTKEATCEYDAAGVPVQFTKANGESIAYENGHIKQIITTDGTVYTYTITSSPEMQSILVGATTDSTIPVSVYYNSSGQITKVTNVNGDELTYENNLPLNIVSGGNQTQYAYSIDALGNIDAIEVDRDGIKRIYDAAGNLKSLSLDDATSIVYENGEVKEITKADGTTIQNMTFSESGGLSSALVSYPDGSMAVYQDAELLQIINASGSTVDYHDGKIRRVTLSDDVTYDWSYDGDNIIIIDNSLQEKRTYAGGLLLKVEELTGTLLVTNYYYDTTTNVLTRSEVCKNSEVLYAYTYTYQDGLTLIHDQDGNTQAYTKEKKLAYIIDATGKKYSYTYVGTNEGYIEINFPSGTKARYDASGTLIDITLLDGTVVKEIGGYQDGVPTDFAYVQDSVTYTVIGGKISKAVQQDGVVTNYYANGFVQSIQDGVLEEVEQYQYYLADSKICNDTSTFTSGTLDDLDYYVVNNAAYLELSKQYLEFGDGSDGDLVVAEGQTVTIDGTKNYASIYVARGATLTVSTWDGEDGGSMILKSLGPVVIEGAITVSATGYRGGEGGYGGGDRTYTATAGESYLGLGATGAAANGGGGGAGQDGQNHQPDAPNGAGGGGGGYGTGGGGGSTDSYSHSSQAGASGSAYGNEELDSFYMGSGGGGGGCHPLAGVLGGVGGAGGGQIKICAPTITISGTVSADGGNGTNGSGGGGGGSGGAIWLSANTIINNGGSVSATGGIGGASIGGGGRGGNGGDGRIRLDYIELVGDFPAQAYTHELETASQGTFESAVFEANALEFNTISWSQNLPEGTSVVFQMRAGDTVTPDETWSDWSALMTDPAGSRIDASDGKYMQYKVTMTTVDTSVSPSVIISASSAITVGYNRAPTSSAELSSLSYMTRQKEGVTYAYNADGLLIWSKDTGGAITAYDPPFTGCTIEPSDLVFDYACADNISSLLPTLILNDTQKAVYLRDDIIIAELTAINNVSGASSTYAQGELSSVSRADATTVTHITFDAENNAEDFTYTSGGATYVVRDGIIREVTTASGDHITYTAFGAIDTIESASGVKKYTYNVVTDVSQTTEEAFENGVCDDAAYMVDGNASYLELSKPLLELGDGSDGELRVEAGQTVIIDGTKNYSSVYVASGATLTVSAWNGTSGGDLFIKCTGTVDIQGTVQVDAKGRGEVYGTGHNGEFVSAGGMGGTYYTTAYGGGGGGYGTEGQDGIGGAGPFGSGTAPEGGNAYGDEFLTDFCGGSNGGIGLNGAAGGKAGGTLKIIAQTVNIAGTVSANGGSGSNFSGGGSGGAIWIIGENVNVGGSIAADGGSGGGGSIRYTGNPQPRGGNGGEGRIRIDYTTLTGNIPTEAHTQQLESAATSGTFDSEIIEIDARQMGTISWCEDLPAGTDIYIQTRTGNTATPDWSWSGWSNALTDNTGSQIASPAGKYIQYRVTLTTQDNLVTPRFLMGDGAGVTIHYVRDPLDQDDISSVTSITMTENGATTTYAPGEIDVAPLLFDDTYLNTLKEDLPNYKLGDAQKVITIYDQGNDIPVQTVSADHSITYFEDGYATKVVDKNGTVQVQYTYDDDHNVLTVVFVDARQKLEENYQLALAEIVTQKDEALAKLAAAEERGRAEIVANAVNLQKQIQKERERLTRQQAAYDTGLYDISAFGEAFAKLNAYEIQIQQQAQDAYADLTNQVAEARARIEADSQTAMRDLIDNDYNNLLGDIVQKESSPVIYHYYRKVLGRDPGEDEFTYWMNTAKAALSPISPTQITQHLQNLPEYAERQSRKANIIADLTSFFTQYLSATDTQKQVMLSSLGLTSAGVVTLTQDDIDAIVSYLNGQSLHFGDSAFQTTIAMLKNAGITKSFEELAKDALKIDILTGVITKDTKGDLVISMYAMRKAAAASGLTLYAAKLTYSDLKDQVARGNVIIHINGDHYVLVTSIDDEKGTVTYTDTTVGADGTAITITRTELMNVWKGYALSGELPADPEKQLNATQEQNIRGSSWWSDFWKGIVSFFQKIVAPVSSFLMMLWPVCPQLAAIGTVLTALNVVIQTVSFVVRTGTLMDVVWAAVNAIGAAICSTVLPNVYDAVGNIFGSIGSTISTSVQGAFQNVMPMFDVSTWSVQGLATGIGSIFNSGVQGSMMTTLTTGIISKGIELGANFIFTRMHLDPTLSTIASALLSGAVMGILSPSADTVARILTSGTIAGVGQLGQALDLDPNITNLAGMMAGSIIGGALNIGGQNLSYADVLNSVLSRITSECLYAGISSFSEILGIDPRISSIIGMGIRGFLQTALSGDFSAEAIWRGIQDGVSSGIMQVGVNLLDSINPGISQILRSTGLMSAVENILHSEGLFNGVFTIISSIVPTAFNVAGQFVENIFDGARTFMQLASENDTLTATDSALGSLFSAQTIEAVGDQGGIAEILSRPMNEAALSDGRIVQEMVLTNDASIFFDATGEIVAVSEGELMSTGTFVWSPDYGFRMSDGVIEGSLETGYSIHASIDDSKATNIQIFNETGDQVARIDPENQNTPIVMNSVFNTSTSEFTFTLVNALVYFAGTYTAKIHQDAVTGITQKVDAISAGSLFADTNKFLYALANGIANTEEAPNPPKYILNLEKYLVRQSSGSATIDDMLPIPLYQPTTYCNLVDGGIIDVLKWIVDSQTVYKDLLTKDAQTELNMYFLTHPTEWERPVVGMGYSGGLLPLIAAISSSGYNVKTIVGLGAATTYLKAEFLSTMTQLLLAVVNKSIDAAQSALEVLGFGQPTISDFIDGVQNYYYDKIMPVIKEAFRKTIEQVDPGSTTFSYLTGSKTDLIVNVYGTKDILYECGIADYRENFCGKTTYNIEIIGASHFDYMERDTNSIGNPPDTWNITVAQFTADLMLYSKDQDMLKTFLDTSGYAVKEGIDYYRIYLPGWENHQ